MVIGREAKSQDAAPAGETWIQARAEVPVPRDGTLSWWVSCFLGFRVESSAHGRDQAVPAVLFFAQSFAAGGGEFVIFGAAVVVGGAPACLEQALPDQAKKGRVEGALFDEERAAGDLFDAKKDAVAMEGAEGDGFQNQ
jgi:hypothetical protein